MDITKIKLLAFDLDGTLAQHKQYIDSENRKILYRLAEKYKLVMVGAGQAHRIFQQMGQFPIDIIGNYGMQQARYDRETGSLVKVSDVCIPCDKESVESRITALRERYGFTEYVGDNVQFHPSGCVTFPILGTKAELADKLAFDPDRSKRREIYEEVSACFPEFTVFLGGTSSFDMAPAPYNKYYALDQYCEKMGIRHEEVVFIGDDYGPRGNDEPVYKSDIAFIPVKDYRKFPELVAPFL